MSGGNPQQPAPADLLPGGISKDLLDILICPACREALELKPDGSGLKCVACKRLYPIRDGVPIMLVSDATVEG